MWFWKKRIQKNKMTEHIHQAKLYMRENYRDEFLRISCYKERCTNTESIGIKYSLRTSENQTDYYNWEKGQRSYTSFSSQVLSYMEKTNLNSTEFYTRAGFDRKLFSKIKTDYTYQPAKSTAIQCCLALHLNESEANELLKTAGYAFSNSNPLDLAIRYCINHQIYELSEVNELLLGVGVMPIC